MISCLLTTQQRSGPESSVTKFICINPFPLNLNRCAEQTNLQKFVEGTITNFGGLRRAKTIGDEVLHNFKWLKMVDGRKLNRLQKFLWKRGVKVPNSMTNTLKGKPQRLRLIISKDLAPNRREIYGNR